jgi:hypothetical protein
MICELIHAFLAQRRSSLQTLGSIGRLQDFYGKKSLKHNK